MTAYVDVHETRCIVFPILESQATEITEICHLVLFGKGSDTTLNEYVRRA